MAIDFGAALKTEAGKLGIPDVSKVSSDPISAGVEGYRIGGAAACAALGHPEIAPLCGEVAAKFAESAQILVKAIAGGLSPDADAMFRRMNDPNLKKLAEAIVQAREDFWAFFGAQVDVLLLAQSTLGLRERRTREQIVDSMFARDRDVLPIQEDRIEGDGTLAEACWNVESPYCHVNQPGVPDFFDARYGGLTGGAAKAAKEWPEKFSRLVAAETAMMIAQAVAEREASKPSPRFVYHGLPIERVSRPPGGFGGYSTSPMPRKSGGLGFAPVAIGLLGLALYLRGKATR